MVAIAALPPTVARSSLPPPANALVAAIRRAAVAQGIDEIVADELANNAAYGAIGAIADAVEHRVAHFGLRADPEELAEAAVEELGRARS